MVELALLRRVVRRLGACATPLSSRRRLTPLLGGEEPRSITSMIFDVMGRRDDEGTGWLSVDVMAEIGTGVFRRGARVGRVGREELGIGKTVGETVLKEG